MFVQYRRAVGRSSAASSVDVHSFAVSIVGLFDGCWRVCVVLGVRASLVACVRRSGRACV